MTDLSHTAPDGGQRAPRADNRTALLHIRVKPILVFHLERKAQTMNVKPSALARKILAEYLETHP